MEFKEWHEGYVAQYHRTGKHLIQFRISGESKWMLMKKVVFYILERPVLSQNRDENEYKEGDVGLEGYLAPVEVFSFQSPSQNRLFNCESYDRTTGFTSKI